MLPIKNKELRIPILAALATTAMAIFFLPTVTWTVKYLSSLLFNVPVGDTEEIREYRKGHTAMMEGSLESAERHLNRSLEIEPNSPFRITLAKVLLKEGKLKQAKKEIRRYLQLDPYSGEAYIVLVDILRTEKSHSSAIRSEIGEALPKLKRRLNELTRLPPRKDRDFMKKPRNLAHHLKKKIHELEHMLHQIESEGPSR